MKRTYQPNKRKRAKCHGFRSRMSTSGGRAVLSRRRAKGRKRLCVQKDRMLDTIKSNNEISEIFSNGKRISSKYINFIYIEKGRYAKPSLEHDHIGRVAFIAGKKNGNAIWRNSAKRRLREIYRKINEELEDHDILLIAKPAIMQATFNDVYLDCKNALKRIDNGQ